jgi:CRP/FNR family transcriptional regulator
MLQKANDNKIATIQTTRSHDNCNDCSIRKLCLPVMLAEAEVDHLDSIIQKSSAIQKGQYIFHAGQNFEYIYAVRAGSFVNTSVTNDGIEQITGFFLPGEIIGLDSIHSGVHLSSARALETSSVCAIPFEKLEGLSSQIPALQKQLFKIMSQEIHEEHDLMMLLGNKSADQRLAAFLINLSHRFKLRGLSPTQFRLTMTRSQIGAYLGLAVETVSRLLTRFSSQNLIIVADKEINITNISKLASLGGTECVN